MSGLAALVMLAQVGPAATPETATPPPETPSEAASTATPAVPPRIPAAHWLVAKVDAGGFYSRIFSIHATGLEGGVAVGSSSRDVEWDLGVTYGRGSTGHGLGVARGDLGMNVDWILDRLRLGVRPSFGVLSIERATRSENGGELDPNTQFSIRMDLHASFDVLRFAETDGLYVLASLQGEANAFGPFVALGYRFEAEH